MCEQIYQTLFEDTLVTIHEIIVKVVEMIMRQQTT